MTEQPGGPLKLVVLNPGGRDPEQYFDTQAEPDSAAHPPVNFHGYAACSGGSFHRDVREALAEKGPVLLLLRGKLKAAQRALTACREAGRTVVVSLKETGIHQMAEHLSRAETAARFFEIVSKADGCIAPTPEVVDLYRLCRGRADPRTIAFIPTPYPLGHKSWDFSTTPDKQSGIIIGTREWDVPSRNHAVCVLLARQLCESTGETVTLFNLEGRKGRRLLDEFKFPAGKLRLIETWKSYPEYLRELSKHKIVLQLDRSRVPGQVAGDALLCRTICVGGDSTIERIAFPKTCGVGRTVDQIGVLANELLANPNVHGTVFMESQWRSIERLSFEAVEKQLRQFFSQLPQRL